ncbi:MAG: ribosome biogenesis GTP-binding protein YihA/YsxC [Verrucomicrobium sp.]|jgi:GTP-binding protein|nr:ribosome biogenesis GTP-binding protein YihA/YsxC [Verrucomicrobium sp.]
MPPRSAEFVTSATDLEGCPDPIVPEFAFIGRSNVGKSSLINRLTGQQGLAKVSATPGHTKTLNFYLVQREWHLVDLPGYGFAQKNLADRERFEAMIIDYLEQRESLIRVFVLIDSRLPMQKLDRDFVVWLIGADIDFALVYTKVDKTKPAVLRATRGEFEALFQQMGLSAAPMFETSSETGAGKVELLRFIAAEVASVQADGEDEEDSSEVDGPHPSEGDRTAAG